MLEWARIGVVAWLGLDESRSVRVQESKRLEGGGLGMGDVEMGEDRRGRGYRSGRI